MSHLRFLRIAAIACLFASWALLAIIIWLASMQPLAMAALNVVPVWLWAVLGVWLCIVSLHFRPTRVGRWLLLGWLGASFALIDEVRPLLRVWKSSPQPRNGLATGTPLRVLTLNAKTFQGGNSAGLIASYSPDLIFFQEIDGKQVDEIRAVAFPEGSDTRHFYGLAILSRWNIRHVTRSQRFRHLVATIDSPSGPVTAVNLHLATAATDLRLWNPDAWRTHAHNRRARELEVAAALELVATHFVETAAAPGHRRLVFGGDFNSPAGDAVHRRLPEGFIDAYATAGTGWGNTYHRRFPILRIDCLYSANGLRPLRAGILDLKTSDHRALVVDFVQ